MAVSSLQKHILHFCENCGKPLDCLNSGCAGVGAVYGCPKCDRLYLQTKGTFLGPVQEEVLVSIPGSYGKLKAETEEEKK